MVGEFPAYRCIVLVQILRGIAAGKTSETQLIFVPVQESQQICANPAPNSSLFLTQTWLADLEPKDLA